MTAGMAWVPAEMPLTPLARGMEGLNAMLAAAAMPKMGPVRSGASGPAAMPRSEAAKLNGAAGVSTQTEAVQPGGMDMAAMLPARQGEPGALPTAEVLRRAEASGTLARYASRDENGRVWGAPSAFGGGQCLGCHRMAKMPSLWCAACQLRRAEERHEPMAPEDLARLREAVNTLIARAPNRRRREAQVRMEELYAKLQEGRISGRVQGQLVAVAQAVQAQHGAEASRVCGLLASEHWEQHKAWLVCLRGLVGAAARTS